MKRTIEQIQLLDRQIADLKKKRAELWRKAPRERIDDVTLARPDGVEVRLSELFGDKRDLIVVHNMGRKCVYCTLWADGFTGLAKHLEDCAAFVLCSPDEPAVLGAFAESRGWNFRTVSCHGTEFARDAGFEREPGKHWPGVSCFRLTDDGAIERTGLAHFGPGDDFCSLWHFLDLLDKGADGWSPKYDY